jgi:hypothetical protein
MESGYRRAHQGETVINVLPIRVNQAMGVDAILGKAQLRCAFAARSLRVITSLEDLGQLGLLRSSHVLQGRYLHHALWRPDINRHDPGPLMVKSMKV